MGYAWSIVGLLWFVALLSYLDRLIITSMRDPMIASISMTETQFGLLTSVFLWVYGIFSPFGGYLADRFSRSKVILGSLFVWSAMTWLTGHARNFEELLWARALMGLSEACYIPAALALIADYHTGSTRSLANGLHMSGVYAGAAMGGVGGYIAEWYGWRFAFELFGIVGVVYAVILIFLIRDPARRVDETPVDKSAPARLSVPQALLALFSQRGFLLLLAANATAAFAYWGINGWMPSYLKEQFHLGLGEAGMSATGYIQLAGFIGVLIGGTWADRWSQTNSRARALVPALGFCVAAPCLFISSSTTVFVVAIVGLIVFGLGRGFFDANLMPVLRQVVGERYSATGYGFLNFVACMSGGVIVYAGGALRDAEFGLGKVFQYSAVGLFCVGLILFFVKQKPAPKS